MTKWKRIKLNEFKFPKVTDYNKEYLSYGQLPQGVELNKINKTNNNLIIENLNNNITGVGDEFTSHVMANYNTGISLYIPKSTNIEDPIKLEFNMDDENPTTIDQNIIIASANSESTIIFDYTSKDENNFHNGVTKVYAKKNSVVNIIKIQRMDDKSYNFDSNIAYIEGRAVVNWISVEIGSDISGSNFTSILEDEASEGNLASIYLGNGTRKMDLEYTMIHKGRRSISNIETRGVLMDQATKVFRGNLDFKKGAKLSKGVEEEFVVLLDPTVKSHSIPALLCEEDDVQGEHAASAGQINDNQLFYLMSRGLDIREAKQLIIQASFRPILDKIPMDDLRDLILEEIDRRLLNG
ncbi:MAG: Fe-S cluster assembly protein SufD [Tissierella sp.]|nr:Fe-S cluster assembly protein SufD [Tissierella sp.]